MAYLIFLFIGLIAGWLASIIVKGRGFGILIYLLLGIVGSFIGGTVFALLGIRLTGFFGLLLSATAGVVLLIWLINLLAKK